MPPSLALADAPVASRRLPTTFLTSMVFRVGTVALNALTGIMTARALAPSGRGEVAAMILWPMLFAGLTTIGLPSAIVYHLRRDPEATSPLIGWALLWCTLAALVGTAVGWSLIPLWLSHHPPAVIRGAQWCLLTTLLCSLTLVGRGAWEARGYFRWSAFSQLVTPLMVAIGLGVLIAADRFTPFTAAAVYVTAGLPSLFWILGSLAARCRPTLAGGRAMWGRLVHYGMRSYGVDLCGILSIYLDQALVVGLLNPAAMGIYAVGLSLSRVIGAIHASVAMIVFPRIVGLDPPALVGAVGRSARLGTIVAAAVGACILAVGPALLTWLYGPAYGAAARILPILVVEAVVAGLAQVLLQGFLATGRPGVATMVLASSLVISVPLFLVLVPAYGVMGASVALLGASTLRVLLTLTAYRWLPGMTVPRVWLGADDMAEIGHYRRALRGSVARLRATVGLEA